MSRCTSRLSDSERYDNDDEISKLFALDEEVDDSFSGFSQCTKATTPRTTTGTVKKNAAKNQLDQPELLKTLCKGLSDTLVSTLSQNNEKSQRPSSNIDMEFSENESVTDEQVIDTNYNIFSDEENEPQVVASDDEFDYELPKSFEGDKKYVEEKSDVSVMTRDMKIPVNCKSLVAPPVNAEIWQFLERKAKTADLNLQTIQKSLGCGMGYKIEFDKKPIQEKIPVPIKFNNKEKALIDKEIVDMLEKGAIKESFDESEQFISNIFLVKKEKWKI
ncbi:unnamed protein product [Mytilus edulis]|uniref:Uncharacterized protein n=1 Tax=Mytilus edulis TaxID=6550 RepID=A0A8S3PR20_MYTED|nr:unnamed protein product [Mytilus edulis]